MAKMEHNLLVISDLHLGEELSASTERRRRAARQTLQALEAFLGYYADHRIDGRPWKLVMDGDTIDFLGIPVSPTEAGLDGTEDDAAFGFGATEPAAVVKLERILHHDARFFEALAVFLDGGHEVHLVTGNHDAELHFDRVRARLRREVEARCAEPPGERLQIHPWFFMEPGLIYVEHGHQYDPFCSFESPLTPEDPLQPDVLEENLGIAAMRYLGNHLPVDPDETVDLSLFDYLRLLAQAQGDLAGRFIDGYAAVVKALLYQWWVRVRHPKAFLQRRECRRTRLERLAAGTGLELKLLLRLHRLRRPPVFVGLLPLIRSVMLGRLLTAALFPPVLLLSFIATSFFSFNLAMVVAMALVAAFLVLQLWLALGRDSVDPTESMVRSARKIAQLLQVPVVVFGHSHVPLLRTLGRGAWYVNTGSWVGGEERPVAFTHLRVLREERDRVRVALCRWQGAESRELRVERIRLGAPLVPGRSLVY